MNKHILVAMDRKNRTKKELFDNAASAFASAFASASDYASASVYSASASAHADDNDATERRLNEYFEVTGENKQDYIDAIEASK